MKSLTEYNFGYAPAIAPDVPRAVYQEFMNVRASACRFVHTINFRWMLRDL